MTPAQEKMLAQPQDSKNVDLLRTEWSQSILISVLDNILLLLTAKMGLKDSKMDWKIMGKKKKNLYKIGQVYKLP